MMSNVIDAPAPSDADLYEADFYAWTQAQAQKLRDHSANAIDWENLAEEIDSVGKSQKHEIRNRLVQLLAHLLKWEVQPQKRCMSWQSTISEQRVRINGILEMSPSLWRTPADSLDWSYRYGRREAARETQIALKNFPETCPYTIDDILNDDFMPGPPWSPDDLILD
jgi:hypothetical protein